jgi:Flp pilus assembly protein TadB
MAALAVIVAALLASAGVAALGLAVRPGLWSGPPVRRRAGWSVPPPHRWGPRLAAGVAAGGAVWAVTGWPAAGLWLGALAAWLPSLAARGRARQAEVAKVEAIARFAEMLRDQILVGADVAHAVTAGARVAPGPIADAIGQLQIGLQTGGDPAEVVTGFAATVDDPMADLLAVGLKMALTRPTARLSELFAEAARATREQASLRRDVEAERRRLRTVTWSVLAAVVGWLTAVYILSGRYLAPYGTPVGQAVLVLAGGAFATGLVALSRMDRVASPGRLSLAEEGRRR